ncbi:MAG: hypothetical protein PUF17_10500 [Lactimicrobium massiliense]|jgi:hypothetical protein|nr:hypothetical protein [Lactimicrobium massiliense]MDD6561375.1 hypothetical protein [Lactimicrobium massiliense]
MNLFEKAETLTELYMKAHDFTDLTPSEFADKYHDVYDEILQHLKSKSSGKQQKVSY